MPTEPPPWQTEPEIDPDRQQELTNCLRLDPDPAQHRYPFKDAKLSRADVEWLLLQHRRHTTDRATNPRSRENRWHTGLDLRGAILCDLNLRDLPLAGTLFGAHLVGRDDPEWKDLNERGREHPYLTEDKDEQTKPGAAADLRCVDLRGADLRDSHFTQADLRGANLGWEEVPGLAEPFAAADLEGASLIEVHLEADASLHKGCQPSPRLVKVSLRDANLSNAHLQGANLYQADLTGARLFGAHLEGASLVDARLVGADLRDAYFDHTTKLGGAVLADRRGIGPRLAGVKWNGVNLSEVDWAPVLSLKDGEAILEAKAAEARGEAVARAIEAYVTLAVALEPWIPKEAQRFRVKAKSIEIEQEQGQSEDPKLTPKEREVLRLLADGRSDAEICKRMHITANTLNTHIKNILGKLEDFGVETREQAVAYVWKHGITLP